MSAIPSRPAPTRVPLKVKMPLAWNGPTTSRPGWIRLPPNEIWCALRTQSKSCDSCQVVDPKLPGKAGVGKPLVTSRL